MSAGGGGGLGGGIIRPLFGDKVGDFFDPLKIFKAADPVDPPPPLPPPVTRDSKAVRDARAAAIRNEQKRKGRKSTILTSSRGVEDDQLGIISRPEAQNASTLLGG